MAFNLEGALAGAGKGLSQSAGFLKDKYDKDFKERQNSMEFSRKMHLEDLRRGNNLELAKTQRDWQQEDAKTQRGYDVEDVETKFGMEKELLDYKQQGALELAGAKVDSEKSQLEKMKLSSEIRENLAQEAKYLAEAAKTQGGSKAEINSKLMEIAAQAVMTQKKLKNLSVGEQMSQVGQAYQVAYQNSGLGEGGGLVQPKEYNAFMELYKNASQGDAKSKAALKQVLESGKVPETMISVASKLTGFSPASLFQKGAGGNVEATSALDTSMEGPPQQLAKKKLPLPKGYKNVDWNQAIKAVEKQYGNARGTGKAYEMTVMDMYDRIQRGR